MRFLFLVLVTAILIIVPVSISYSQGSVNDLNNRIADAAQDERNEMIHDKNEKEYWGRISLIAKAFTQNMERAAAERQRLIDANFKSVATYAQQFLYKNRTTNPEAKYLLASLVRYEPRLLRYAAFPGYTETDAIYDLHALASEFNHPGAQYDNGVALLKDDPEHREAWVLLKKAAAGGHFIALQKVVAHRSVEALDMAALKKALRAYQYKDPGAEAALQGFCDTLVNGILSRWDYATLGYLLETQPELKRLMASRLTTPVKGKNGMAVHPLLKIMKELTMNLPYRRLEFIADAAVIKLLEEEIALQQQQSLPATIQYRILGDIYRGMYLSGETAYRLTVRTGPDYPKALLYYRQSATAGDQEAIFRIAQLHSSGLPQLALRYDSAFQLFSKLAAQGYAPAYGELGRCYELGKGTAPDAAKALQYYTQGVKEMADTLSLHGLFRSGDRSALALPYPVKIHTGLTDIHRDLEAHPSRIRIIHFWHQGFSPAEYEKTISIASAFPPDSPVKLVFANINHAVEDILGLSKALGYKGPVYQIALAPKDSFRLARKRYADRLFGVGNPLADRLVANFGDINPEFDPRWIEQGYPATFVYIKGEKKSFYFPAHTTAVEIIAFVRTTMSSK
ncbi:MAG: tetratricopeptide repeat protein [Chitinophagaceae bacterium]